LKIKQIKQKTVHPKTETLSGLLRFEVVACV